MGHSTPTCNKWTWTWFAQTKYLLCHILHKDIRAILLCRNNSLRLLLSGHVGKLAVSSIESRFWFFQSDGAATPFHRDVREVLKRVLPQWWIGHHGPNDNPLFWWPHRTPVVTLCDLFLCGYVKDTVYVSPLPRVLHELQNRTMAALGGVTTLQRVWQEIDYRLAVCRVKRCAHIDGL
jgi:hypothetical protein